MIAVTGASGYVGGAVVRRLRERGVAVCAYGLRPREQVADPAVAEVYESWDITEGPLADAPNVRAVVHCAGAVTDWGEFEWFERVNVHGTRHVVDTWPAARFVNVSSASIYNGQHGDEPIRESDADPLDRAAIAAEQWFSNYSHTKRLAEYVVATRADDWITLRPQMVYGPDDTQLVPRLLERVRGGKLVIPGDGGARISVVHIDNFVHAIERALDSEVTGAFNVVDLVAPSVDDALRAMFAAIGRDIRIVHVPLTPVWRLARAVEIGWKLARRTDSPLVSRYAVHRIGFDNVLDPAKAQDELGYAPRLSYPESFESISVA